MSRRGTRILIFGGWFGSRNAGDEAILVALEELLREAEPGCEVAVHTIDPDYTRRVSGAEPVFAPPDASFFGKIRALFRAYLAADVFLVSGGTPIFDYFFASRAFHLGIPLLIGKPMIWVGIGTKPVTSRFGRWFYRAILNRARYVSVRDPDVGRRLAAMGVTREPKLSADSAICMRPAPDGEAKRLLAEAGLDPARPLVALAPIYLSDDHRRHYHEPVSAESRERAYASLASLADHLLAEGRQVVFLPMHQVPPDDDRAVIRDILGRMSRPAPALEPPEDPRVVASLLGQASLVVAMRLHALVLASAQGVPIVGIGFDLKVGTYMDYLSLDDHWVDIQDVTPEGLRELTERCWEQRDTLRGQIEARMAVWRGAVRESVREALAAAR